MTARTQVLLSATADDELTLREKIATLPDDLYTDQDVEDYDRKVEESRKT